MPNVKVQISNEVQISKWVKNLTFKPLTFLWHLTFGF
jgi:hypothetical protein